MNNDLIDGFNETYTLSGATMDSSTYVVIGDYANLIREITSTWAAEFMKPTAISTSPAYLTTVHLGRGAVNVNYYATLYHYNDQGLLDRVVDPVGTITRTVYDLLGRPVSSWIGVNDTPADGNPWSPTENVGAAGQLLAQVSGIRMTAAASATAISPRHSNSPIQIRPMRAPRISITIGGTVRKQVRTV